MTIAIQGAIVLIDDSGHHQIAAPIGFDWQRYPQNVTWECRTYHYVGTTDSTPHYRITPA